MRPSQRVIEGVSLTYTEDKPGWRRVTEQIDDAELLLARLEEIQSSRSSELFMGVNVEDSEGNRLSIALADEQWALICDDSSGTYMIFSIGDPSAQGDVELRFQQWDVLHRRHFVPARIAADVIRHWFATKQCSPAIEWERMDY